MKDEYYYNGMYGFNLFGEYFNYDIYFLLFCWYEDWYWSWCLIVEIVFEEVDLFIDGIIVVVVCILLIWEEKDLFYIFSIEIWFVCEL